MSNEAYYKFEKDLIAAVMTGEADAVRGALAGVIRWSMDARFARDLYVRLTENSDPTSAFREKLKAIESI